MVGPRLGLPLGDLTSAIGAPAAVTDPAGYVLNADGTQHVVFAISPRRH
jgi:hypothetical protein